MDEREGWKTLAENLIASPNTLMDALMEWRDIPAIYPSVVWDAVLAKIVRASPAYVRGCLEGFDVREAPLTLPTGDPDRDAGFRDGRELALEGPEGEGGDWLVTPKNRLCPLIFWRLRPEALTMIMWHVVFAKLVEGSRAYVHGFMDGYDEMYRGVTPPLDSADYAEGCRDGEFAMGQRRGEAERSREGERNWNE